jgi:flagellar biosynthesis GTPase FlhF
MKVYIYKKEHWEYTEILGVYAETGMLREKQRLLEEAASKRAKEISDRELEIEQIKQERRELSVKDQNTNVPVQQALKASGDREALKAFKKERRVLLREIDRLTNQIWHLEFENHLLEKLEGEALITHYFPKLYFDEQHVLD